MLLLAEITWVGMGLLMLFGLAMFKCTRGSCGRGGGFVAKTLGVVAVVAGVWMLVSREPVERHIVIDHDVAREVGIENLRFAKDGPLGDNFNPLGDNFDPLDPDFDPLSDHREFFRDSSPRIGMFVLLGAGLIILGAMLFGRDKQKPFALKAITWLGIGAIIFAVANFFGEAPHADRVSHRVVDVRARQFEEDHAARRPSRPGRAKRPSLRPDRPAGGRTDRDEAEMMLPPRAGSIPVELEIARAAAERKEALEEAERDRQEATEEAEQARAEAAREVQAAKEDAAQEVAEAKAEAEKEQSEAEADVADAKAESEHAEEVEETQPVAVAEAKALVAEPKPAADGKTAEAPVAQAAAPESKAPEPHRVAVVTTSGNRPAWVTAGPALVEGVYRITVSSGPWSSVPECQHALDEEVLAATNNYINEYLGNPQASSLVNISPNYLRQHVRKTDYSEIVDSPAVGQMHQLHAQLAFDERARADFERMWRNAVVQDRLWYIGGGGALVLALLATLYGYLKLELRTDTASRGKLQLAATLVALIVAAGALLARWTVAF